MENGQKAQGSRGTRGRLKQCIASDTGDSKTFRGRLENPELASLLDEIWAHQCADSARLLRLCDQAVEMADCGPDETAGFWARITRVLLAHRYRSVAQISDDLSAADLVIERVTGSRARRLLHIGHSMLMLRSGEHRAAFERFSNTPLGSLAGIDDADDYFIQSGIAQCASRLHRVDTQFKAQYSNLLLAERTGPPVRHAVAAAELAADLIPVGRAAEALELLEGRIRKTVARFDNPLLLAHMRVHAAIAKYALGRAMDAHNDLVEIVHDGLAECTRGLAFLVHSNLMGVCLYRGLLDEASEAASQAYGAATMRASARLGLCHQGAGLIAHAKGDSTMAIELLEQALACFERHLPIYTPMNTHVDAGAVLAQCHASQRRLEMAYAAQRRFFDVYRHRVDYATRGQLAAAAAQKVAAARIDLSERELECLSWSAAGKTAWETGKILHLSEWTVVYHLEKAKRKFGLTKKQEVIGHAISLGLIKPHRGGDDA